MACKRQFSNGKVVITGLGMICPLGTNLQESWTRLLCSHSGIKLLTEDCYTGISHQGQVEKILQPWIGAPASMNLDTTWKRYMADCSHSIQVPNGFEYWPRWIQLLLISAQEAIDQAGLLKNDSLERERIGTCIGTGIGNLTDIIDTNQILLRKGSRRVSPYFIPRILLNTPTGLLCQMYKLRGPSNAISTACATGASALIDGFMMIQSGDADMVIVGATEASLTPLAFSGFSQLKALATGWTDDPQEASRPFDTDRNGFVMGEGAGVIILEKESHAKERNVPIFAEMIGYGVASDAYHITAPCPHGNGAKLSMKRALQKAGVHPDQIDYVNCHATSTPLGDQIELNAMSQIFHPRDASHGSSLNISSSKGAIGHLLGAAGIVESIFSIMALQDNILPPTLHLHAPISPIPPSNIFNHVALHSQTPKKRLEYVMKNSFGFGGINASLLFQRFPPKY